MKVVGDIKIYHWDEIKDEFRGADIFLGNGFSIGINESLNYKSLFAKFLTYLEPSIQARFKRFNSTNFEAIQNTLTDASEINRIFGIRNDEIEMALQELENGLINAIKDLHPNFLTIDPQAIYSRSQKLDWFGDIYTTNYDIFLYHILLATLDRHKYDKSVKPYQDFFRTDGTDLRFVEQPISSPKNIFYLHGALFLFNDSGQITKIRRGSQTEELIDLIRLKIRCARLPVFVSEGKASLKEASIGRNKYLSFCRSAFRASKNCLVMHGFSFASSDDHLIQDLNKGRRTLAIGLYLPGLNASQIIRKCKFIAHKLYNYPLNEIRFLDSSTLF